MSQQRNQNRNNNRSGGGNRGGGGGGNRNGGGGQNRNRNNRSRSGPPKKQGDAKPPAEPKQEAAEPAQDNVDARNVVFKNILFVLLILCSVIFVPEWTSKFDIMGYAIPGYVFGMIGLLLLYLFLSVWFLRRVREE